MHILIKAEGDRIAISATEPMEVTHRLAATLLRIHARLIGRVVKAAGGGMAAQVRSSLSYAFLAVMSGQSPAGQGAYRADTPISIIYDTEKEEARFVVADGSLPGNPAGALLLIYVRLSEIITGDIDYVFFSEKILESYDRGAGETGKEEEAER